MPDFPLGKRLSNSLVGGWLPWTFAHWASTYIVSFKSYLPSNKIYLSWTAGWDFSWALSHGSERLRTKLHENHTLSCSTSLYMYGLDIGVYPPSPSHRISDFVFNCHLFFSGVFRYPCVANQAVGRTSKAPHISRKDQRKANWYDQCWCSAILLHYFIFMFGETHILRGSHIKWTACIKCT